MRIKLYPYKVASESARSLKNALIARWALNATPPTVNAPLIITQDSPRTRPSGDVVINWGNSTRPENFEWQSHDLNHPDSVKRAANKLVTLNCLASHDVPTPDFTNDPLEALDWAAHGHTIVIRHRLNAHSGEGIELFTEDDYFAENNMPVAPLYVKYKKKRSEYRVHVFGDDIIDIQEKRKQIALTSDRNELQSKIRSHANGWAFCREDLNIPDNLASIARNAVRALDLDFGAVDIIYNQRENQCYVLEVNTAVGLEGSTVGFYADAITDYVNSLGVSTL